MAEEVDYDNYDLINNPKNPKGNTGYGDDNPIEEVDYDNMPINPGKPIFTGNKQVGDITSLGDSQWDSNTPLETLHNLDAQRAELQPWTDQLGNALSQAVVGEIVGGTIEGLGYVLDLGSIVDVMKGDETEWGNFITDFGQSIREGTEENTRIYEDPNREEGFFSAMGDSGWWFKNSVSVASTLSMMIPSMAATKALSLIGKGVGVSKGLGAVRKAAGLSKELGVKGKWIQEGVSQAVISRNIENWMEAHGTFEDHKATKMQEINPETGVTFTEEEATKLASEAASDNWKNGWAMLAQDMVQYLSIGKVFNPVTRKMETALGNAAKKGVKSNIKPWMKNVRDVGGTFLSEGGEESYQFYISERAKLRSDLNAGIITQEEYEEKLSDAVGSEEMMTSAFFGGLGGSVFQAAGPRVSKAFKSKTRKEFEDNVGKNYTDKLKHRAAQMQDVQKQLANADQEGLGETRKHIIDEMMVNMTAEALENDNFEAFYETMESIPKMSEEDKAQYTKDSGNEFDSELAKLYTPDILKTALDMRVKYLKHRNKFDPTTSSRLTKLEVENERLANRKTENKKNIDSLRKSMGHAWEFQANDTQKKKWDTKEKGTVLRRRIKTLKNQLKDTKSPVKKNVIQKAIDYNEAKLKIQAKETAKATKVRNNLDAQAREQAESTKPDNDAAQEAYDAVKDDIISAREYEAALDDKIIMNNAEMVDARSESGQERIKKSNLMKEFSDLNDKETINKTIEAVKNQEFWSDEEREEINNELNKKIKDIENAEGEAKATRLAEEHQAEMAARSEENNVDPNIVDNQVNTPLGNIVEDENAHEEPNIEEALLDKSDKELRGIIGSGRNIPLLDKVSGTEAFQEWNENPVSKVGREFEYTVSERSPELSEAQNDAIQAFESANDASVLPKSVFDNLPIKATLKDKPAIFTYLPTKPDKNSSEEAISNYKKGYTDERVNIISRLKSGQKVISKVNKSSGGNLQTEYDYENNLVPENSIIDIQQIKDINDIEIMVSNEEGYLVDTMKEPDADLGGTFISVGKDAKRNQMPYRGGVFLKVKKANGQPFPLRLNLLKNTSKQSELIAEMLIKIAVPVAKRDAQGKVILNDKGVQIVEKESKFGTKISELDEGLQDDIQENMLPELEMLDPKSKNPTLLDLINAFVYVSPETANKTSALYIDGNDLVFGNERMTLISRGDEKVQDALVTFLEKKKRRQFNLTMWNDNPAYKKYVIDNRIINTNAVTNEPLFKNDRSRNRNGEMTGRRIQLYMEPTTAPIESGPTSSTEPEFSNQSTKSELAHDKGFVFSAAAFGKKTEVSQVGDTKIRKDKEEDVSSPELDFDDVDFDDVEFGSAPTNTEGMDSGKPKKDCK